MAASESAVSSSPKTGVLVRGLIFQFVGATTGQMRDKDEVPQELSTALFQVLVKVLRAFLPGSRRPERPPTYVEPVFGVGLDEPVQLLFELVHLWLAEGLFSLGPFLLRDKDLELGNQRTSELLGKLAEASDQTALLPDRVQSSSALVKPVGNEAVPVLLRKGGNGTIQPEQLAQGVAKESGFVTNIGFAPDLPPTQSVLLVLGIGIDAISQGTRQDLVSGSLCCFGVDREPFRLSGRKSLVTGLQGLPDASLALNPQTELPSPTFFPLVDPTTADDLCGIQFLRHSCDT